MAKIKLNADQMFHLVDLLDMNNDKIKNNRLRVTLTDDMKEVLLDFNDRIIKKLNKGLRKGGIDV